ncbi:MAG: DUF349 domain-containing protein [Candidatus Limimorpha sp.]|nr:DUF349 domain-containing protein [Bacteroidales bacterium]MDD7277252.1 DUF349 domain-containing protein [Bacteroidales bacterium]MDY6075011.1 DUF349 domain-containing protein [Bacteroidales bacterium]
MNATERETIEQLNQPTILPNTVKINVNINLNEEEILPKDEEQEEELDLANDNMETEEEVDFDFSSLNKLQLVELLEETVQDNEIVKIKDKVTAIKVNFLRLNKEDRDRELEQFILDGGDAESYEHTDDPLEVRFKAAFNIYKNNKAKYNELLEQQKLENLKQKNAILEELKQLIYSEETLKKTYDDFRALQDKWKEIGQVPANEISNIWNSYHFLVEKFYDKVKINRELRDLDLRKNLEAKIALCEKAEELLLEKSLTKSFKLLQKYHDEWKEIGPVPQEKRDEIWERFKSTTDKINQIRRDHYAKIEEEQKANYDAKVAICEKMEEIVNEPVNSINAYQKKSNEVNELFKLWKQVGPIHKKQSDEIWNRFKGSMNSFFDSKKEFFSKLKVQQMENYNKKLQICVEVENLVDSTEWKKTTDYIKKLQEEWKNIGPVPKRHSDKIWKRFRTACDAFFKNKSEHFSSIKGKEDDNLKAKQQVIENIKAYELKKDRNENMEAIRGFQREWMSIGHVPMKMKDALQKEYRDLIDGLFDKMRANDNELSTTEFRNMVNGMKDDPGSRDKIRRERINLQSKIQKLRDEIATLENNIGFFAASKQSDLLKAEYEKKIAKIKNDVKVLEAKMKILNEQ